MWRITSDSLNLLPRRLGTRSHVHGGLSHDLVRGGPPGRFGARRLACILHLSGEIDRSRSPTYSCRNFG